MDSLSFPKHLPFPPDITVEQQKRHDQLDEHKKRNRREYPFDEPAFPKHSQRRCQDDEITEQPYT